MHAPARAGQCGTGPWQTDAVVDVCYAPQGIRNPYPLKPLGAGTNLGGGLLYLLSIPPTYRVLVLSSMPSSQRGICLLAGSPPASCRLSSYTIYYVFLVLSDRSYPHPGSSSRIGGPKSGAQIPTSGSCTDDSSPYPAYRPFS